MDNNQTRKLIYLASPYSHPNKNEEKFRFQQVCSCAAYLMSQGWFIFSPIAHTHPIAVTGKLKTGWDYWQHLDELMISRCDELWVYMLSGWCDSVGVNAELKIAHRLNLPVRFIKYQTHEISEPMQYWCPDTEDGKHLMQVHRIVNYPEPDEYVAVCGRCGYEE